MINIQKLVSRIEELEDLVEELRTQNSPKECMDLRSLVESQGLQVHELKAQIRHLSAHRLTVDELFEANELYETF